MPTDREKNTCFNRVCLEGVADVSLALVKLPDELPEAPYEVVAFRVNHFHPPEDDEEDEGTVLLEVGARLPGTEAELVVPFEMTPDTVIGLVDELLHQYRCLEHGLPEDDSDDLAT